MDASNETFVSVPKQSEKVNMKTKVAVSTLLAFFGIASYEMYSLSKSA